MILTRIYLSTLGGPICHTSVVTPQIEKPQKFMTVHFQSVKIKAWELKALSIYDLVGENVFSGWSLSLSLSLLSLSLPAD
jgi:hypothetical protein